MTLLLPPSWLHSKSLVFRCFACALGSVFFFFLSIHNPWILCCVVGFSHHRSALVCCVWFPADHWRRRAAAHNQKRARESLHWFEVMTKLMDSWNHDVKKQLVNGIYASSLSLSLCLAHFLIFSPLFHRVSCETLDLHTLDSAVAGLLEVLIASYVPWIPHISFSINIKKREKLTHRPTFEWVFRPAAYLSAPSCVLQTNEVKLNY